MATVSRLVQDAKDAIDALESKLEEQASDIEDLKAAKELLERDLSNCQDELASAQARLADIESAAEDRLFD